MAPKLTRRSQQRIKRMTESIDAISKLANRISLAELEELVRRDQIVVTAGDYGGGGSFSVSRRGSTPGASPVERAVIASVEGRKVHDPLKEQIKLIERHIIEAEESLRRIHESMKAIREGVDKEKVRKVSDPCEVCLVLPAAKTAMCIDCYKEWVAAGAPDRFRWKSYKQQVVDTEGRVVVETPPPARHPISNS